MANTNFSALTSEQLTIWSRDFWRVARNMSFINQFAGSGPNAMVQRINELTQSEKGARAVLTLLADMTGDGIVGDNTCLLYTSPSPRDVNRSRMPSSA